MAPGDPITDDLIERYSRDGVVMIEGAIAPDWIEVLRAGLAYNIAHPSARARVWNRDEHGRTTFYDSQAWREIPQYRDFVLHSPLAGIAGYVMNVSAVNFFFDAVFVRSPGVQFRTPFHQDEPY